MDNKTLPDIPEQINTERLLANLITAFHILHRRGVLDEYGHVSVRNPANRSTFFTSSKPANLIFSARDLDMWNVDGTPVEEPVAGIPAITRVSPFSEHWTHSCILARYPDVQSVVHSHSPVMVAAGLLPPHRTLRPTYHMAGFIGVSGVPVFDAAEIYKDMSDDTLQHMLVNDQVLGEALADSLSSRPVAALDDDAASSIYPGNLPTSTLVLQRGHGFVTWATSLEDAVFRAVMAQRSTDLQMKAQKYLAASSGAGSSDAGLLFLSKREAHDSASTINGGMPKAWPSWATEVKRCGMYVNKLAGFL